MELEAKEVQKSIKQLMKREDLPAEEVSRANGVASVLEELKGVQKKVDWFHSCVERKYATAEAMRHGVEKIFNTIKTKYIDEGNLLEEIYKTEDLSSLIQVHNMNQYVGVLEIVIANILRETAASSAVLNNDEGQSGLRGPHRRSISNSISSVNSLTLLDPLISTGNGMKDRFLVVGPNSPHRGKNASLSLAVDPPSSLQKRKATARQ